jgi:hypothetical protein
MLNKILDGIFLYRHNPIIDIVVYCLFLSSVGYFFLHLCTIINPIIGFALFLFVGLPFALFLPWLYLKFSKVRRDKFFVQVGVKNQAEFEQLLAEFKTL